MTKEIQAAMLEAAARQCRECGMKADEAMNIVAKAFGAIIGRHGTVDGWTPGGKPVRKVKHGR